MVTVIAATAVRLPAVKLLDNPHYAETGALASLAQATDHLEGNSLLLFGDALFKPYILQLLMDDTSDVVLIANHQSPRCRPSEYVKLHDPSGDIPFFFGPVPFPLRMGSPPTDTTANG